MYKDNQDVKQTDDFDVTLVVVHAPTDEEINNANVLNLKIYILLTSHRYIQIQLAPIETIKMFVFVQGEFPEAHRGAETGQILQRAAGHAPSIRAALLAEQPQFGGSSYRGERGGGGAFRGGLPRVAR